MKDTSTHGYLDMDTFRFTTAGSHLVGFVQERLAQFRTQCILKAQ